MLRINNLLGKLSVSAKLRISIIFASIIIVTTQYLAAYKLKETMTSERKHAAEQLIDSLSNQIAAIGNMDSLASDEQQQLVRQLVKSAHYGENGYFFIFDLKGYMVMHPVKPELDHQLMTTHAKPFIAHAFSEFVKVANYQGKGFVYYVWPKPGSTQQEQKSSFIATLPHWQWAIGTGIYLTDIEEQYHTTLVTIALEASAYILLLIILSTLVAKNITKPLAKLTRTMALIATNKDLTIELKTQGNDELTVMAKAFNQMNHHFRIVLQQIHGNTLSLASQAEELATVTTQIQVGITQQHSDTDSVQRKVAQLNDSSLNVYANTNQAIEIATKANDFTAQGLTCLSDTVEAMEKIDLSVHATEEKIAVLQTSSQQIGDVLDVIKNLADQTNLLALNAAIEAARAGEQGRGFTVVADEVRSLAKRTQQSTDDIQEIIKLLQQGVADTVTEMERCKHATVKGISLTHQCNDNLKNINGAVAQLAQINSEINSASQDQNHAISDIAQNMYAIAAIAEQTQLGAKHTQSSSQHLSEMSQALSQMVEEFKVH